MPVGEWDHRQLCPDGACVGVIGPAGTCKVCGRAAPNWGEERTRGLVADVEGADPQDAEDDADEGEDAGPDPIDPAAPAALGEAAAWQERQLCPDGACIGLLGPSGACNVCGKRRDRAAVPAAARANDEDAALARAADELAAIAAPAEVEALAPSPAATEDEDEDEDEDDDEGDEAEDDGDEAAAGVAEEDELGAGRALCPDGACVGVIGADGRCKVCGTEAA